MSILIVAPRQPSLPALDDEVASIVRCFHRPILVQGNVTEADLQRALTTDIEAFWFAGHASDRGVTLSNDFLLPVNALAQYLSSANVEWSFFNSCDSGGFVRQLQSAYPHDTYAYITEIADIEAWRTARLVALNYSSVGNILQAVKTAAPAGSTPLRYFPSPDGDGRRMSQRDIESVQELSHQLKDLSHALIGDTLSMQPGLIATVRSLQQDVEGLRWWLRLNALGWIANGVAWLYVLSILARG